MGLGHHQTTFEALELTMGPQSSPLVPYFDACRQKRNQVDYYMANAASERKAEELLVQAKRFQTAVEDWVRQKHPWYAL
jgi:hypothetical protein